MPAPFSHGANFHFENAMLQLENGNDGASNQYQDAMKSGKREAAMDLVQQKMATNAGVSDFSEYQSSMNSMRESEYQSWAGQQAPGSVAGTYAEASNKLQAARKTGGVSTSGENKGEGL